MQNLPLVLTMGEPAGIGPELTVKAKNILKNKYPFYVIGNFDYLTAIAKKSFLATKKITHSSETFTYPEQLCIIDQEMSEKVVPGKISLKNSSVLKVNIERAVSQVISNQASGLVTNPINKWALQQSNDFPFQGHTDFLASLDPIQNTSVMMLKNRDEFRVIPVTIHVPIKKVSKRLTSELLENTILTVYKSLRRDYLLKMPKMLITGLNPHAGESSAIGYEEIDIILPTINKLKEMGLDLTGPVPADSAFTEQKRLYFDAFVCMYHDQALIPVKTLSFDESINITLGLSFIRTSPDHGTALDIAGENIANPGSLILAIEEAHKIASSRISHANKT